MAQLQLADILTFPVVTVTPDRPVHDALSLMRERMISSLVVVDGDRPVGIFTERDAVLLTYRHLNAENILVGEVMSKPPLTALPGVDYHQGYGLITAQQVRHLIIVNQQGELAGIVSEGDFLKHLSTDFLVRFKEVGAVMVENVVTFPGDATVDDAVCLMRRENISCIVVEEQAQPLGIFTERDLVRLAAIPGQTFDIPLVEVMTRPVCRVTVDTALNDAIQEMDTRCIRRLVVVDAKGCIVGLVTRHDIVKQLYNRHVEHLQETLDLRESELTEVRAELKVERELRRTEERLAESQRLTRIGSWELKYETGELWWSDETFNIFEVDPRQFESTYEAFLNELHPDDRHLVNQAYTESVANHTPYDIVHPLHFKDGRVKYVNERCETFYDDAGKPLRSVGTVQDITEREQAQQLLSESQARYQSYFIHANNAILIFDPEGDLILDANPKACELLEYGHDELLHTSVSSFHPDEMEALEVFVKAVFSEGNAVTEELTCLTKSRQRISAIITGAVIPYEGNTAVLAVVQDVSDRVRLEESLAHSELMYRQLFERTGTGMTVVEADGTFSLVNQDFAKLADSVVEDIIGRSYLDFVDEQDRARIKSYHDSRLLGEEAPLSYEFRFSTAAGRTGWTLLNIAFISETGQTLASVIDVTETKQAHERLRLAASVFDNTAEGIVVTDTDGNIIEVNKAFTEIMGYSREEILGRNPRIWQSGRHDINFYRNIWKALIATGSWRGEIWNRRKDGDVYPGWQNINGVFDEDGKLTQYVSVVSDISQIKQSQEKLDHLAHHDALTGLPNRLLLSERLKQAIRHADRTGTDLALFFLDLDHFKHINDSLGHPLGDQLLQDVAEKLTQSLRREDTVARVGGDEFVLLLGSVSRPEDIANMAEKLLKAFRAPVLLNGHELSIGASLGISLYPQDGKSADELLHNADAAMYRAKEEGRNNYQFYTEALTHKAFERVLMENNLRQALEKEEFILHYQPQLDLHTGKIVGAEALIRWQQPQLGLISPSRFIPIAEDSGLIMPIGEWVLQEACSQAKKWLDKGIDIGRIAVNVAGPQLQRGRLVEVVQDVLAKCGLPASRLEIEVTESLLMQKTESAIKQLDELRQLGIVLAIDDFGTGYSSLSYLKQLPIHKLKIDRSFVHDIPGDPDDMAIADAVIALGKSLGLTVIAEGVETLEQAEFLRGAGCQEVQGYLYSQPVTAEQFEQLISLHELK
ncbi:diguanylate cyclase/phosphodiesterase [Solemya velum gill symbiont]|uniref:cyclic-guanylate-specific phosphodiesterase n=2 Tax=Solemya velum gill symbiont TaxID=2340 RepID=A0A0B0HBZ2_SOVGS|nr:EAL domain-containing protein [Solemya velum gill symbiont]KHF26585.1 diguanylate cyclase/phosphodiesterase [Solemya velum gill symbiont]